VILICLICIFAAASCSDGKRSFTEFPEVTHVCGGEDDVMNIYMQPTQTLETQSTTITNEQQLQKIKLNIEKSKSFCDFI
jgi:hypothetical protein